MAETASKATGAKSTTAAKSTAAKTDDAAKGAGTPGEALLGVEPNLNVTGADNPLTPTDGEKRPEQFGANSETFESAAWAHTHGTNPEEQTQLSDY